MLVSVQLIRVRNIQALTQTHRPHYVLHCVQAMRPNSSMIKSIIFNGIHSIYHLSMYLVKKYYE